MARKRRSRRRNPSMSLKRPLGLATSAFKGSFIKRAVVMAAGIIANRLLVGQITKFFPSASVGALSYVAEGVGAGLLAAVPKVGTDMSIGAGAALGLRAVTTYVTPALGLRGLADDEGDGAGLMDYETLQDYDTAGDSSGPMSDYETLSGISW